MKVQVTVNNVKIIQPSILNENEYNIHNCEFEFTEEYNGLTKKAVFTDSQNKSYVETIVDNKCSIPIEVCKRNERVKIGVYAYAVENEELLLRYSPQPTEFFVHEGSYKEGENTTPPTPSEVEQLQAQITSNKNDIEEMQDNIVEINEQQEMQDETIQNITETIGTINETIGTINETIGEINQDIDNLENTKADKSEIPTKTSDLINDSGFVEDENYVHTDNNFTDEYEAQISQNASDISTLQSTKADKSEIPTKTSDLTNDSGFIDKNVNDLTNYTLKTNTGSLIDLEINGTTYVITLSLKDVDGNVISTDTIDLPLESVVVGGSFDAVNKKIVLTLENGNTVDIPVGDLIAGLQTEITSQNKLASDLVDDTNSGNKFVTTSEKQTWNAKYDKPVGGIPSTDLASDVQTSLEKADTAIQQSDLADYVKNTDYANANKGGVIRLGYGLSLNSVGQSVATVSTYQQYRSATNSLIIGKGTLENVITGKELVNKTQLEESQATQDTEIETLQNQVTDLEQDVEDLRGACLSVEGTGTDITLNNTAKGRLLKNDLSGRTEQEQLTGKNLLPFPYNSAHQSINKDGQIVLNGNYEGNFSLILTNTLVLPAGTYILSFGDNNNDLPNGTYALLRDVENDVFIDNYIRKYNKTFTLENSTKIGVTIVIIRGTYNNEILEPMIRLSSITDGTWEKYCGGIPAPNPIYKIPIKNVTGNSNVKIQNKNLFTGDYSQFNSTGGEGTTYDYFKLPEDEKTYYLTLIAKNDFTPTNQNFIGFSVKGGTATSANVNVKWAIAGASQGIVTKGTKISINNLIGSTKLRYISLYTKGENSLKTFTDNFYIQLEENEATSYVPHKEQNYPFTFSEGQRGMQGTELKDDGIHQKRARVDLSTLTWTQYATNKYQSSSLSNVIKKPISSNTKANILAEKYKVVTQNTSFTNGVIAIGVIGYVLCMDETGTPSGILEYELEEEEIIPYNETQQEQYSAILQARSYDDITYITSESDELGFNMKAIAVADANKVINSLDTRLLALESEV